MATPNSPVIDLSAGLQERPAPAPNPAGIDLSAGLQPIDPAQRPGTYQQTKGGQIHNANDEAADPFTDGTTSVLGNVMGTKPTGALMKREDETDAQFIRRAVEAGQHVTPEQIETEKRSNNARVLPTLAAAPVMGAAQPAAAVGAGAAADSIPAVVEMAKAHPVAAKLLAKILVGGVVGHEVGHDVRSAAIGALLSALLR